MRYLFIVVLFLLSLSAFADQCDEFVQAKGYVEIEKYSTEGKVYYSHESDEFMPDVVCKDGIMKVVGCQEVAFDESMATMQNGVPHFDIKDLDKVLYQKARFRTEKGYLETTTMEDVAAVMKNRGYVYQEKYSEAGKFDYYSPICEFKKPIIVNLVNASFHFE